MRVRGWFGGLAVVMVLLCSGELEAQDIRVSATILPRVEVEQLELAWLDLTRAGPLCREGARPVGVHVEIERDGGRREPVEACLAGAVLQRLNAGTAAAAEEGRTRAGSAVGGAAMGGAAMGERITVWLVSTS